MDFAKFQGTGNDFVMFSDPEDTLDLTPQLVRRVCDRRFGVGADGVIRVGSGVDGGELFMDYMNSDGSVGEMCGNGIRCLAVFARARGMTTEREFKVATRSGLKVVSVLDDGQVQVDMGEPVFDAAKIPVVADDPLHVKLKAGDAEFDFACVSMGNPHAVAFVPDPGSIDLVTVGPEVENNAVFSNKANVEFARIDDRNHITMVVWERGAGATLACGTGACAVAVAACVLHDTDEDITVSLPGGDLRLSWEGDVHTPATVMMTGPAKQSFEGELDLREYA